MGGAFSGEMEQVGVERGHQVRVLVGHTLHATRIYWHGREKARHVRGKGCMGTAKSHCTHTISIRYPVIFGKVKIEALE